MENIKTRFILSLVVLSGLLVLGTGSLCQASGSSEKFTVSLVKAENGTYNITPSIPDDGNVAAGTVLTITAIPDSGYSLDCIYYTVQGGMWGTTSYEYFVPEARITVDQDMQVGAIFIESSLVENINVTHDVVFAQPGVKPLKYDVFSPKGARNLPAIIIVHGGGWSSNNEDIMRGLARELVKGNQYVVFSIDYRWINTLDGDAEPNHMHDLINDVFGAIAHIQEHAAEYGADPTRIAVTGDSAGGHLSAAAALLSPLIGDRGFGEKDGIYEYLPTYMPKGKSVKQVREEITRAIKAAAPSYGPFDAADFSGFLAQTDQGYLDAISPINHIPHVSERAIPHFMVRGTRDFLISHEMVQNYTDLLKAAGQRAVYVQVEDAGHAFFDWKPDARTRDEFARFGVPWAEEMKAFFDSVFYE